MRKFYTIIILTLMSCSKEIDGGLIQPNPQELTEGVKMPGHSFEHNLKLIPFITER